MDDDVIDCLSAESRSLAEVHERVVLQAKCVHMHVPTIITRRSRDPHYEARLRVDWGEDFCYATRQVLYCQRAAPKMVLTNVPVQYNQDVRPLAGRCSATQSEKIHAVDLISAVEVRTRNGFISTGISCKTRLTWNSSSRNIYFSIQVGLMLLLCL